MDIRGGMLQLRIDDAHARYPLRIDPFFQQGAKLTGTETGAKTQFGLNVALSGDGNTALIGGPGDKGEVGAAWVFTRSGSTWGQQGAKLTGSGESGKGLFGYAVALSSDGNTALIGGGSDNVEVGAAWVFTRTGTAWAQQGAMLTGAEETGGGEFGEGVALSADGKTALIGGGTDNAEAGAAWVFTSTESVWAQQGPKLTGAGEVGKGHFGFRVALSETGDTALIAASRGGYAAICHLLLTAGADKGLRNPPNAVEPAASLFCHRQSAATPRSAAKVSRPRTVAHYFPPSRRGIPPGYFAPAGRERD